MKNNKEESFFDGKLIQLIGLNILSYLLAAFSLGLLIPFIVALDKNGCKTYD